LSSESKNKASCADIATIFDCIDASEGRLAFARTNDLNPAREQRA
jgi:hypothetical protein